MQSVPSKFDSGYRLMVENFSKNMVGSDMQTKPSYLTKRNITVSFLMRSLNS